MKFILECSNELLSESYGYRRRLLFSSKYRGFKKMVSTFSRRYRITEKDADMFFMTLEESIQDSARLITIKLKLKGTYKLFIKDLEDFVKKRANPLGIRNRRTQMMDLYKVLVPS